jgi:hypothetical protein
MTGGRVGFSIVCAIKFATPKGSPIVAVIAVQNFKKSLRETPLTTDFSLSCPRDKSFDVILDMLKPPFC